ncbi:MAG: hypothetical protein OXH70_17630 [Acidobacteria bacterium]|nr:hypothetical protein [Acidobacteriota bacterium]
MQVVCISRKRMVQPDGRVTARNIRLLPAEEAFHDLIAAACRAAQERGGR